MTTAFSYCALLRVLCVQPRLQLPAALRQKPFGKVQNERRLSRSADGDAVHLQGRNADADGNRLAILAAGADAVEDLEQKARRLLAQADAYRAAPLRELGERQALRPVRPGR